jgi:hypothetical protein
MKKYPIYIHFALLSSIQAQNQSPWKRIDQTSLSSFDKNSRAKSSSIDQLLFRLDQEH